MESNLAVSPAAASGTARSFGLASGPGMLAPWADVLFVGGASIVLVLLWACFDFDLTSTNAMKRFLFINFVLNAPHFMASYKLLYGSPDKRRRHPGVTWVMPAILAAWSILGLVIYRDSRLVMEALVGAGAVSLAWHYTGQAWGMMASFAYIHGTGFAPRERRLIRANLFALMTFHVVWALVIVRRIFEPRAGEVGAGLLPAADGLSLYRAVAILAASSVLVGLAGLVLFARRTGRFPPLRVLVPWIAVHLWYVLIYNEPGALFWVQNAHALQYLVFPMRTEINRLALGGRALDRVGRAWRMVRWYVLVVAAGLVVLWVLPWLARTQGRALGFGGLPVELAIISFVNLHHYFIDGVIWKIRNPAVRRDLFSHLAAPAPGR